MSLGLLTHHHAHANSVVHRLPAEWKLGTAVLLIVTTVIVPPHWFWWYIGVSCGLLAAIVLSRIPPGYLLKRLLLLSPFVLGVALVNAWQPHGRVQWQVLAVRSALCLTTIIVAANTTPFSQSLRVLRRVRVPALLVTTIALMHRYLFVLAEEGERMRRARASRTFTRGKRFAWKSLATVVGQLFIRASERAERIYDAMCARGWK